MLEIGEALIPILAGYWVLTRLHYTHYGIVRDSGYHLFFKSAIVGTALFIGAHLLIVLLSPALAPIAEAWRLQAFVPFSPLPTTVAILGIIVPVLGNRLYGKERAAAHAALRDGDLVELLIAESIEDQKLVGITLKNRKSYIGLGIVSSIETVDKDKADIEILPIASGFRDKHTQELVITENYAEVFAELSYGEYDDFCIVLPMSEVVSARIFNPEAYTHFQESKAVSPL